MGEGIVESRVRVVLDSYVEHHPDQDVSFALSHPASGWRMNFDSRDDGRPYFVSSITKLYTTAITMQLRQEGRLGLDDRVADHLDTDILAGIHVYRGVDHAESITIRQLLSHTSGLPDYFLDRRSGGGTVLGDAKVRDHGWTFDQALSTVRREMSPVFVPGARRRAHFSNVNFMLLGAITEELCGVGWNEVVEERIIAPLGLRGTRPALVADADRPGEVAEIFDGTKPLKLPLTMASSTACGNLISTADDGVTFLRAFLGGELFEAGYLAEMTGQWRRIFFPFSYSLGVMRLRFPRLLSPGPGPREFIGHAGASGALLYFAPDAGLYISGSVNQLRDPGTPHRLMMRLAAAVANRDRE